MTRGNGHDEDDDKTPERPIMRNSAEKAVILAPFANLLLYLKDVFEVDMRRAISEIISRDDVTVGPYEAMVLTTPVRGLSDKMKSACDDVVLNAARAAVPTK